MKNNLRFILIAVAISLSLSFERVRACDETNKPIHQPDTVLRQGTWTNPTSVRENRETNPVCMTGVGLDDVRSCTSKTTEPKDSQPLDAEENTQLTAQTAAAPLAIEPPVPFEGARFLEHIEYLAADELRGRNPGTEGSRQAAAYIIEQYRRSGLQPLGDDSSFVQVFPWKDKSGRNLVALFRGAGDLAEQAIVVSAHYDHLGTDQKLKEKGQDAIYNGADDNASGVAALLLIAEACSGSAQASVSSRRSVIFIAFDCEERGLAGSRYYCQHPRWELNKTVAVINLDMVGRLRSGQVYASDIASSPFLANKLEELAASHGLLAQTRISGVGADHRAFLSNGIPAFNLSTGPHSDGHRVTDEAEKINSTGGACVAWLGYSLLAGLASHAEPIPFHQVDSQFDVNLILRVARGLGIVPSLAGTAGGYPETLEVRQDNVAAKAGVQPGDQITGLNGHVFERIEDILTVWSQLDLYEVLKLSLLRGEARLEATISAEALQDLLEGEFTRHSDSPPKTEPHVPDKTRLAERTPSSLPEFTVEGVSSYYMYSNGEPSPKKGLPAIIFLGHPEARRGNHQRFAGKFHEPVLLIWCDLFFGLDGATCVDDRALWRKKRREFVKLYGCYKERFGFDPKRVYLTGFSFSGAYSWMLAYDRPDLYAGVVAMSAVSYPEQIQTALRSGESVVTVVVRGEKDAALTRRLAQEEETGRIVESSNSHSKFVLKPGEDHGSVSKYWVEHLNYILQFKALDKSG